MYAYNTDRFSSKEEYLLKYPGDEWVDIIGLDIYQRERGTAGNEQFIKDIDRMLSDLEQIAQQKNKLPALTEFGFARVPDNTWWTEVLWKGIRSHHISYALAWRNAGTKPSGENEYYVPNKGQVSAMDFKKFYSLDKTLFQKEAAKEKLYK